MLPELHPGTPTRANVEVQLKIVRDSPKAYLVEHPTEPVGQQWLPKSIVVSQAAPGLPYRVEKFFIPVWLYLKIREKL